MADASRTRSGEPAQAARGAPTGMPLFLRQEQGGPAGRSPLVAAPPPRGLQVRPTSRAIAEAGRAGAPSYALGTGLEGNRLPSVARVFDDAHAHAAATRLGVYAYTYDGDIVLGGGLGAARTTVLGHELVHARQSRREGPAAGEAAVEQEALAGGAGSLAADPGTPHALAWIPILIGGYILLRPNVANAPGPGDTTYPSVSPLQVAAEAVALFGLPGGAGKLLLSRGWSVVAVAGTEGALGAVGFRGVQDAFAGEFSGVDVYVVDATTGALVGVFVGGTFQTFRNWRAARQAAREGAPGMGPTGSSGTSKAPRELFHHTDEASVGKIHESGSIWGKTEGRVYASPFENIDSPLKRAWHTGVTSKPTGSIRLTDEAADLFQRHPEEGWYSGLWKRKGGQYVTRKPGHDLAFDSSQAARTGNVLNVSQAELRRQALDQYLWGHARLWGRRIGIDWGIPVLGAAGGLYGGAFTYYPYDQGTRLALSDPAAAGQDVLLGPAGSAPLLLDEAAAPGVFPPLLGEADLPPDAPIIYVQPFDPDPYAVSRIGYNELCPSCHSRAQAKEPSIVESYPGLAGDAAGSSLLFDLNQRQAPAGMTAEELKALEEYIRTLK